MGCPYAHQWGQERHIVDLHYDIKHGLCKRDGAELYPWERDGVSVLRNIEAKEIEDAKEKQLNGRA